MENETNDLLRKLETENDGKLTYKTYALFLGLSGKGEKNLGGLLYKVNDLIIFEDFERQGGMLQLLVKRKQKYEKTKFSFKFAEIKSIDSVSRSAAMKAVKYNADPRTIRPVSGIGKVLGRTISQILMQDGSAYYFELFDEKNFKQLLNT